MRSDTPRTDAEHKKIEKAVERECDIYDAYVVMRQFSCQLERELAEAKAQHSCGEGHVMIYFGTDSGCPLCRALEMNSQYNLRGYKWRQCARGLADALKLEHHENEGYLRGGPHALARFDELEKGEK